VSKKKSPKAPWAVFIAIILAFFIGNWTGTEGGIFGITFYSIFDLVGKLFIQALTLVVVPLVTSSIILGIARIGNDGSFGRLSAKIFGFYVITTLCATVVGLVFVNLLSPGTVGSSQSYLQFTQSGVAEIQQMASQNASNSIVHLILSIVPSNIFHAFAQGQMLAVIFFSMLFGFTLSRLQGEPAQTLRSFFQGLFDVMIGITHLVMKCLPLGVFCLVAKVSATTGFQTLRSLSLFFVTVVGGLVFFSLVILPLLLRSIAKVNPKFHFQAMGPALLTAFSTSSSAAALPVTMDCVEKRAGVSNRICSLVVPLGTSLNMAGSALYECVGAMFIAQIYGIEMSLSSQIVVVILSLLTSMGVAGIPAASLVAIVIILEVFGLPVEGIGLFLAVDRILDMCRTTVNVLSDSCCAVLVAKTEGEKNILLSNNFPSD
jgi:proton glutamate symport protein